MDVGRLKTIGWSAVTTGGVCCALTALGVASTAAVGASAGLLLLGGALVAFGRVQPSVSPPGREVPLAALSNGSWSQVAFTDSQSLRERLQRMVTQSWDSETTEGIKLEVFATGSGETSSSIQIGKGVSTGGAGEVLTSDLCFAGDRVGRLSVKFLSGHGISERDRSYLRELAQECALVLANARYSELISPQRRESEQQVTTRSSFLANLSHELRSPMAIVLNASELLLEGICGELSADQHEALTMVKSNSEHLMELISDVLDYARVEAGTLSTEPEVLSIAEQAHEATKMVRSQAEKKRQTIRCRPASEEFAVRFDRRHLRQALINLLTNASKYTPEGGSIEVWVERALGDTVRVCVRDSGIGIADADRGKVFEAFERIDHPYARTQIGTGLGLSLTRQLLALNKASIDFHSELGVGSTFWIEVKREDSKAPVHSSSREEGAPRGAGERILMVAPQDEERVLVARYLRSIGYEVVLAADEVQARQSLRSGTTALVLLTDSFTPANGARFASFVREEQRDRHIPVLLLTRRAFLADVERYLREEVDRCLAKPVRLVELARACRAALDFMGGRL